MTTSLKFGDPGSIAAVSEYERLEETLRTYDGSVLRKRGKSYRKQPVKAIKCVLCGGSIAPGSLYYPSGRRSAHDECVDKSCDRRRELAPAMGVRPKRLGLVTA